MMADENGNGGKGKDGLNLRTAPPRTKREVQNADRAKKEAEEIAQQQSEQIRSDGKTERELQLEREVARLRETLAARAGKDAVSGVTHSTAVENDPHGMRDPHGHHAETRAQRSSLHGVEFGHVDSANVQFRRSLNSVPARPGFVQKFVRVRLLGDADIDNLLSKQQGAWRPRHPSTVKGGVPPTLRVEGQSFIGVGDLILMEREEEVHRKEVEEYQLATIRQTVGIVQELQEQGRRLSYDTGGNLGVPRMSRDVVAPSTRVSSMRRNGGTVQIAGNKGE